MKPSRIGLGCMTMAGKPNRADGIATIRAALDAGVTYLNTGDFYGMGASEMMIGEAIRGYDRDKLYISLKFGLMMQPGGGMYGLDVHPHRIKNYLTYSLKRMGLAYVDLYQPCRMDEAIPVEDIVGTIGDLVKEGYVRQVGVSMVDAATLRRAHAAHPIGYVEMAYSLFNRGMEDDILPAARALGIGVAAFDLLASGLLTGKMTAEAAAGRSRGNGLLAKGNIAPNMALVQALQAIADEKGITLPQLAVAWAMAKGEDILPIVGANTPQQLQDSMGAINAHLSAEDVRRIEAAVPAQAIRGNVHAGYKFVNGHLVPA